MLRTRRTLIRALAVLPAGLALAATAGATAGTHRAASTAATAPLHSRVFASGARITHPTSKGRVGITQPDDITHVGSDIYVGFQNGVGPQGQASTTGNKDSTIVEFGPTGHAIRQWDVVGKCDGLTADPGLHGVIATVNEDANSSLYVIDPAGAAVHYRYAAPPPSHGGTDAITIDHGQILISGSAPGTTGASAPKAAYPAVYRATLTSHSHVATLHGVFGDEASATLTNAGQGHTVHLALTDPDSSELVPTFAGRFGGDFMLTSQGDEEQIFVSHIGAGQRLDVLKLSASVDDSAWPSSAGGTLYTTDNDNNNIYRITGRFSRGSELVATTPCDESNAPSTCPGPGFPANYLGEVNDATGKITRLAVTGPTFAPQGMLFLP